jgi:hypothetical protein
MSSLHSSSDEEGSELIPPKLIRKLSNESEELVRKASLLRHPSWEEPEEKGGIHWKSNYLLVLKGLFCVGTTETKKQQPWIMLKDVIFETVPSKEVEKKEIESKCAFAASEGLKKLAIRVDQAIEKTENIYWGPDNLCISASCFNWALCGGELGYKDDYASWPPAMFDWVTIQSRAHLRVSILLVCMPTFYSELPSRCP